MKGWRAHQNRGQRNGVEQQQRHSVVWESKPIINNRLIVLTPTELRRKNAAFLHQMVLSKHSQRGDWSFCGSVNG
jgi:hypothetical protein